MCEEWSMPVPSQENGLTLLPLDRGTENDKCEICKKVYQVPRILACLHSFCEKCLEDSHIATFSTQAGSNILECPVCKQYTLLPSQLATIQSLPEDTVILKMLVNPDYNLLKGAWFIWQPQLYFEEESTTLKGHSLLKVPDQETLNKVGYPIETCPKHGLNYTLFCSSCQDTLCPACVYLHCTIKPRFSPVGMKGKIHELECKANEIDRVCLNAIGNLEEALRDLSVRKEQAAKVINMKCLEMNFEDMEKECIKKLTDEHRKKEMKVMELIQGCEKIRIRIESACRFLTRLERYGDYEDLLSFEPLITALLTYLHDNIPTPHVLTILHFGDQIKSTYALLKDMDKERSDNKLDNSADSGLDLQASSSTETIHEVQEEKKTKKEKKTSSVTSLSSSLLTCCNTSFDDTSSLNELSVLDEVSYNLWKLHLQDQKTNFNGADSAPCFTPRNQIPPFGDMYNSPHQCYSPATPTMTTSENKPTLLTTLQKRFLQNYVQNAHTKEPGGAVFNPFLMEPPPPKETNRVFPKNCRGHLVTVRDYPVMPPVGAKSGEMISVEIRTSFGHPGMGTGQFNAPSGFCLNPLTDDIYVADTNNHRIQVFNKLGMYVSMFGKPGKEEGHLWLPRRLVISPATGNIIICDRGSERSRLQVFNKNGTFARKISIRFIEILGGLSTTSAGHIVVADSVSSTIFVMNETGVMTTWFECSAFMLEPSDIAVYKDTMYVCDYKAHCVCVIDSKGNLLRKYGSAGITNFPSGVSVSPRTGDVFVGDSHGNRFHVTVFQDDGTVKGEFQCGALKMSRCSGLRLTSEGQVITLAKSNNQVVILNQLCS